MPVRWKSLRRLRMHWRSEWHPAFCCKNTKCAAQGNSLDLWARHCELPLYEATLYLADTFGLEIRRGQKRRGNP